MLFVSPSPDAAVQESFPKKARLSVSCVIKRIVLVLVSILLFLVITLISALATIANGPSETLRDALVLSAMQASATKWVPGLFLDQKLVDQIVANSKASNMQSVELDNFTHYIYETTPEGEIIIVPGGQGGSSGGGSSEVQDEWANAIDGMKYFTMTGATYKAYILLVKDPSRVYVGTSSDFKSGQNGLRIFDICERDGAVAGINGGEYYDNGGSGPGNAPLGLTYALGECVWNDGYRTNFTGFDKNNKLIVKEYLTKEQADALGIRDGVSFQTGNVLIDNDGETVNLHYSASNTGLAQRTAIGQRADGTVILVVTDGRTASSLGATHDDIINLMYSLGAVTAGMLDGGSSSMMYYENYYDKYGIDTSYLDEYQLKGLVNKYKAFTKPRRMPTFFLVAPMETAEES